MPREENITGKKRPLESSSSEHDALRSLPQEESDIIAELARLLTGPMLWLVGAADYDIFDGDPDKRIAEISFLKACQVST